FFQAEDGIRDFHVTGVQTCALPIYIDATAQSSRNAAMAMLNLNYVIRDTPYFFNNFAMGVMAIGNNINPLTDSLQRLRKESKDRSEERSVGKKCRTRRTPTERENKR